VNICDYCGGVGLDDSLQKCYICNYDLCEEDILTIKIPDRANLYILICRVCMARYYPTMEFEKLHDQETHITHTN